MAEAVAMRTEQVDNAKGTLLEGVTIENIQEQMRKLGIKPGQRVSVKIVNPWNELCDVIERVSDRAEKLGLTEEKLAELLKE